MQGSQKLVNNGVYLLNKHQLVTELKRPQSGKADNLTKEIRYGM